MIEGRAGGRQVLRGVRDPFDILVLVGGVPTAADSTPTVTITRGDGTAIATDAATTAPAGTTGLYRYTPAAADVADVELFTATWSVTIATVAHELSTSHEVVGAFYVDLADIRELDGLNDRGKFPDQKLVDARRWFEERAELFVGRAFVPRYAREVLSGEGTLDILLEHRPVRALLSVVIDDVSVALSEFVLEGRGRVVRTSSSFTVGDANVAIAYEHGEPDPDASLREAALDAIGQRLRQRTAGATGIPQQAISMQTDAGSFTLSTAGPDRPTGIPSVDQVLRDLRGARVVAR